MPTKKQKNRDVKWYGMKKIKLGQKVAWVAREDKNGWALGLGFNNRTLWLRHLRIPNFKEVKRIVRSGVIDIPLKA